MPRYATNTLPAIRMNRELSSFVLNLFSAYFKINCTQPYCILKNIAEHGEDENELATKLMSVQAEDVSHHNSRYT